MKYRVYFIESFSEGTIKQTDDLKEAAYAYYLTLFSGTYPRISVDGKELRIEQAERLCSGIFTEKRMHEIRNKVWKTHNIKGIL